MYTEKILNLEIKERGFLFRIKNIHLDFLYGCFGEKLLCYNTSVQVFKQIEVNKDYEYN